MITKIKAFKESFNFNIEKVKPTTTDELIDLISQSIKMYGNECDLNFIDTSLIKNMSWLFSSRKFNGDISKWDVSNVTNMNSMFSNSGFNGDISDWNVSNVKSMLYMFEDSKFNSNIEDWTINPNCEIDHMFMNSLLEKRNKLPIWYKK